MISTDEVIALLILVLNIFPSSLGTLISALVDKKGFNPWAVVVWVLQFLLTFLLIGWLWGVYHAYIIYQAHKGK